MPSSMAPCKCRHLSGESLRGENLASGDVFQVNFPHLRFGIGAGATGAEGPAGWAVRRRQKGFWYSCGLLLPVGCRGMDRQPDNESCALPGSLYLAKFESQNAERYCERVYLDSAPQYPRSRDVGV